MNQNRWRGQDRGGECKKKAVRLFFIIREPPPPLHYHHSQGNPHNFKQSERLA